LIAYLLRAIGDVASGVLSWVSPLGWVTKTEAYSDNHWWPVGWLLVLAAVLFVISYYLHMRRDLEAGFFPPRPGKTRASAILQTPLGLALRLQRTGTIAWAAALLLMGGSYGSVMGDLESFFGGNEALQQLLVDE